tara:strand:- start:859 stop:1392 length:534 start_codon:yes stop_codon:yes gene_type:complete
MNKIITLILLFIIGLVFSYNIIEGMENKEEEGVLESPEANRIMELNDIIIGGEKDNEEEISINDFFAKLTPEKCQAIKELIDLVNKAFSEEPGEGNEEIQNQMNTKMNFSGWASIFTFIVGGNIGTTLILKKDNKCGILDYINNLGKVTLTLSPEIPGIGNGGNSGDTQPTTTWGWG